MSTAYHDLSASNFTQDWSNAGLITANNDWSGVPSIMGYSGNGLTTLTGVDPQTLLAANSTANVLANQANPNTLTSGGTAEFAIANPVVAFQGSSSANAPHLVIHLNATGRQDIVVSYKLRDVDGSSDNAVQAVALQYRIGESGDFINVPAGFVADASSGPSLATLETPVSVTLPAAVNGAGQLQVRIITANAAGNDEWVGVDDIAISSSVAKPNVSLSVSSNAGSEAGSTAITVTATASFAVSGDQTLGVAVSGSNITAGDYTLGASTITILDGQTTASTTFTISDDALVEGTETATITLGSPSAGLTLGATITQNISIADNDAAGALTYSGAFNESRQLDGSVAGKVIVTLSGETFTGSNGDDLLAGGTPKAVVTNLPAGLTAVLTRTSDSTAELSLSGHASLHTNASDVSNLGLAFANGAFAGNNAAAVTGASKTDLSINFADAGSAASTQTFTPNTGTLLGSSDASTAIALDGNYMIVGDDEASVLRVYDRAGGNALLEWNYDSALGLGGGELDLEASTRIGNTFYFMGSHSNSSGGNEQNSREHIFSVTLSGTGAQTQFTFGSNYAGLEGLLASWDSSNGHGLGANYFGFAAASANGVAPEAVNGFSIEGLSHDAAGNLLLAFRAPESSTVTREKAIIVPLSTPFTTPTLGTPIELDLGGRGIRSIEQADDGSYLILAGPAGPASAEVTHDFRLFTWSGSGTAVTELAVSLDPLRDTTGGSLESIVDVLSTGSGTMVQLLLDNGDTVWPGKAQASKSLPAAQQQFQGTWVSLGAAAADSTGPVLAASTPADDATNVAVNANIVLRFDEGVKAGAGNFVIKKTSDNSVVATIAASDSSQVGIAFNTVTINPTADLGGSTGYYLQADSTALTDHAGNAWNGIASTTALNFTTVTLAPSYSLLVTEVNSNAGPADFFELYNYGTTAIDLTGWKWDDDSANPADPAAVALSGSLLPGARLIVVQSGTADAFRTAWGLPASVPVLATGGPGLGSADAVAVFDQNGFLAAALNYKTTSITAADGTVINPALRSDSVALAVGHAGLAVGGTATESAVWDGVSVSAPKYDNAAVGVLGAAAQSATPANIGSPGNVKAGASLATPYTEAFASSLGEFTVYSSDADAANTWTRSTSASAAEVNGFGDTATASDWLISKAFDLNQSSVEYLSFTTWSRYVDAGITNPEVRVKVSTDYPGTGNPALYQWTELAYTPSPENSQATTSSGLIDLSAIYGSAVYFAFHYTASGTGSNSSSQWRVDDVRLEAYNGAVLSIAATDAAKLEGNSGTTSFTFTVTRAGVTSGATTVDYAVSGAAVDGADFAGAALPSGSLSFAAGETSKTITIAVNGDTTVEGNEAYTVTLSNASGGASIAQATAIGTIQTDDVSVTLISAVQGAGTASSMLGQSVTIEGVVTAYMPNLKGFFVQEEAADSDGNAATSEGIFVYYNTTNPGVSAATVGDVVRLTANVAEYQGQTQLTAPTAFQVVTDNPGTAAVPAPVNVTLPVADMANWEALEGMLVHVSSATAGGKLVVTDNYNLGRYGSVTLTSDAVIPQYAETSLPGVAGYASYQTTVQKDQVILDDGSSTQNPASHLGRNGQPLSASNTLRAGDGVSSVDGVLDQLTSSTDMPYQTTYRIQPTSTPNFTGDARPTAATLPANITGAEIKVASANVLNYFTTLGTASFANPNGTSQSARGATDATEFTRQQNKIVANLTGLNADVLGLMEMQNNGFGDGTSALDSLVDALNAVAGAGTYAYIRAPYNDGPATPGDAVTAGDDAIMTALIYKPAKVTPVGQAAVANPVTYDAFSSTYGNRVPLAQTFQSVADGEKFTVVVNHFKSKGSVIDADIGDGQGANNLARMEAARDLLAWLATDPTGAADSDYLLIGDFNAYSEENPITYLTSNGYSKVSSGLSYAFDGLWGSLDHALASTSLTAQVSGTVKWAINAEEPVALDYNMENKDAAQDASYYNADPYRSSDHNPILIGLNLGPSDTTAPLFQSAATTTDGSKIILTYNEALDAANKAATGAFTVSVGGSSRAVSAVNVNGSTLELTLSSAIANGQGVTVAYTDPTAGNDLNATQDAAGNDAVSLPATAVTNNVPLPPDTTAPLFQSAATTTDGSKIILTYNEALNAANKAATGAFTVSVGGSSRAVSAVNVNGSTLELTLSSAIASGQGVTVAYNDPTAGNDLNATQDAAGNDVATLAATTVTNRVPAPVPAPEPVPAPAPVQSVPVVIPSDTSALIDGVAVQTGRAGNGSTTMSVSAVPAGRQDNPSSHNPALADIPVVSDAAGRTLLEVSLPTGVGLNATNLVAGSQLNTLLSAVLPQNDPALQQSVLNSLGGATAGSNVSLHGLVLSNNGSTASPEIRITGGSELGADQVLVIDARQLPPGTRLDLNQVKFAVVIGPATLVGGEGRNVVVADDTQQFIVLGSGDDELHGGGGNDVVGSKGGNDLLFGDAGDDRLVGGVGDDTLSGGAGNDIIQGGASDAGQWGVKLDAKGQLQVVFTPANTDLADSTGLQLSGNWSTPSGQGAITDPRWSFIHQDYSLVEDVALLIHGLTGRLPTLTELGMFATAGLSSSQLAQAANDYFVQSSGGAGQGTESLVQRAITQVMGANFAATATNADWLAAGTRFLAQGGSWAEAWLALVRTDAHKAGLPGTQAGNAALPLVQGDTLGETGWSANAGNNKLFGDAGNDVLIGGGGNNQLDGGSGIDLAVFFGERGDFELARATSATAGASDVVLRNKQTAAINSLHDIEFMKVGTSLYSVPGASSLPENGSYVALAGLPQAANGALQGVGFSAEWLG